jgi:hypothetical protein
MGCACKEKANRLERLIPEMNGVESKKRGISKYINICLETLRQIATRLFITTVVLIFVPLMLVFIMFRYLFFNKTYLTIPINKFIKKRTDGEEPENKD